MRKDIYFGSHTLSQGSFGLDARGPVVSPHSAVAGVLLRQSCPPPASQEAERDPVVLAALSRPHTLKAPPPSNSCQAFDTGSFGGHFKTQITADEEACYFTV